VKVAIGSTRSREGAFGALSHGLLSRTKALAQAVLVALAPFYNSVWEE
jgi:non-canonical (house-cleaning) NTP pyrophosphatase